MVSHFNMLPHPEGGFYVRTHESRTAVIGPHGKRAASTAILFLLRQQDVSHLHRLKHEEVWHFHLGGPVKVVELVPRRLLEAHSGGSTERPADASDRLVLRVTVLGSDVLRGQSLQHVVPAGAWFGCLPCAGTEFGLVGCTVAPGFTFPDFELASLRRLLSAYGDLTSNAEAMEYVRRMTLPAPGDDDADADVDSDAVEAEADVEEATAGSTAASRPGSGALAAAREGLVAADFVGGARARSDVSMASQADVLSSPLGGGAPEAGAGTGRTDSARTRSNMSLAPPDGLLDAGVPEYADED